jgi:single-strand DNA-binding protein
MNQVSLIGRLATDPESRAGQQHEAASFRLAVPRRHRSDGTDAGAVFVEVVTFDGLAKTVAEYLTKGRQVAVNGRLEQNEWTAEDGSKRSRIQIIADEVSFLDAPKKTDLEAEPEVVNA